MTGPTSVPDCGTCRHTTVRDTYLTIYRRMLTTGLTLSPGLGNQKLHALEATKIPGPPPRTTTSERQMDQMEGEREGVSVRGQPGVSRSRASAARGGTE
jgi:hypothetical protein